MEAKSGVKLFGKLNPVLTDRLIYLITILFAILFAGSSRAAVNDRLDYYIDRHGLEG